MGPSPLVRKVEMKVSLPCKTLANKLALTRWQDNSLHSKHFQSSCCAKVRVGAKKMEGGREREKRKRLPANPMILENAP